MAIVDLNLPRSGCRGDGIRLSLARPAGPLTSRRLIDVPREERCRNSLVAAVGDIPLMSNQEVSRLFIGGASDSPELNEFPGVQLRPSLRDIARGKYPVRPRHQQRRNSGEIVVFLLADVNVERH